MKNISKIILIFILSGQWFIAGIVNASLTTGSVTNLSGSNNISSTSSGTITLRWSLTSEGRLPSTLPGAVISSSTGTFTNGGATVLGVNNKILSRTITPTAAASTVNITEVVRIPKSVLFTASKLGLRQISYERSFTDCPGTLCNTLSPNPRITFNLTSTAGSTFSITNYKLRFDSDQVSTIITEGDALKAIAHINVTQTGTVRGVWEVATPVTTAGNPSYKIIRTVQRQLTSFATNKIDSPLLPSDQTGIYLVRFRFLEPVLEGTVPTLRYNVTASRKKEAMKIKTLSPVRGEALSVNTEFKWEPMAGARAYKLEFIKPPASMNMNDKPESYIPVAGLLVKPDDDSTKINKTVTAHLKPGHIYWWHVVGLDGAGIPVGVSDWSSIKVK